jgi:hypothetical protein
MNKNIYTNIINGDIQKSIYDVCNFLLLNNNIYELEDTIINICSYIGSFVTIYNIKKYIDIINLSKKCIETDKIDVKNILCLITKMCILCDIHNKNPCVKTGVINVKKLREKIIDIFNDDTKLSSNGINRFNTIIPPPDSETYLLSIKIISNIIKLIKSLDCINYDDTDNIKDISNKLRNCFDYIIRKKFTFETSLFDDTDSIWFLWGFISILYKEEYISNLYWLFVYNYKKNKKNNRIGLLWGSAICICFLNKNGNIKSWNEKEIAIINKIYDISLELFNEVKNKNKNNQIVVNDKKENIDGVTYIYNYIPFYIDYKIDRNDFKDEIKIIT